jgi:hypothetical protein
MPPSLISLNVTWSEALEMPVETFNLLRKRLNYFREIQIKSLK